MSQPRMAFRLSQAEDREEYSFGEIHILSILGTVTAKAGLKMPRKLISAFKNNIALYGLKKQLARIKIAAETLVCRDPM
jgi:hypothetical protein